MGLVVSVNDGYVIVYKVHSFGGRVKCKFLSRLESVRYIISELDPKSKVQGNQYGYWAYSASLGWLQLGGNNPNVYVPVPRKDKHSLLAKGANYW